MRRVNRSALVPYSAEQMFALVDGIEDYPAFLPWCDHAEVHERNQQMVVATLGLSRGGVTRRFTTRNYNQAPKRIELTLVDGPFSHLRGEWSFDQLGDDGSKVSLDIEFDVLSAMLGAVLSRVFEQTCNELVDAFTRRAADVY
ncbi:MAG: type II toxin-antitoxin system RatA family toxin [Pseudomonadota bacterium]